VKPQADKNVYHNKIKKCYFSYPIMGDVLRNYTHDITNWYMWHLDTDVLLTVKKNCDACASEKTPVLRTSHLLVTPAKMV
jgi:hypothetical protein